MCGVFKAEGGCEGDFVSKFGGCEPGRGRGGVVVVEGDQLDGAGVVFSKEKGYLGLLKALKEFLEMVRGGG